MVTSVNIEKLSDGGRRILDRIAELEKKRNQQFLDLQDDSEKSEEESDDDNDDVSEGVEKSTREYIKPTSSKSRIKNTKSNEVFIDDSEESSEEEEEEDEEDESDSNSISINFNAFFFGLSGITRNPGFK